jgi:hypothetical protein
MALGVAAQQTPGGGQHAVVAETRKYIQHFSLRRQRMANSVGRQQRQIQFPRDFYRCLIARFFLPR